MENIEPKPSPSQPEEQRADLIAEKHELLNDLKLAKEALQNIADTPKRQIKSQGISHYDGNVLIAKETLGKLNRGGGEKA